MSNRIKLPPLAMARELVEAAKRGSKEDRDRLHTFYWMGRRPKTETEYAVARVISEAYQEVFGDVGT